MLRYISSILASFFLINLSISLSQTYCNHDHSHYNEREFENDKNAQLFLNKNNKLTSNWMPESIVVYSSVSAKKSNYTYYSDGTIATLEESILENGNWLKQIKRSYNYNGFGKNISCILEIWEDNQWELSSKSVSSFNSIIKVSCFLGYNLINDIWVNNFKTQYKYDSNGNLVERLTTVLENDQWKKIYKIVSKYDGRNNLIENTYRNYDRECGFDFDTKNIYKYDSSDNLIYQLYQISLGSNWSTCSENLFTYNDENRIKSIITNRWGNNELTTKRETFSYLDSTIGRTTQKLTEIKINDIWLNESKRIEKFNTNEKIILRQDLLWQNSLWAVSTNSIWDYNSDGYNYKYKKETFENNESVYLYLSSREYNIDGFVKYSESTTTFSDNRVKKQLCNWEYDINGNNISEELSIIDNGELSENQVDDWLFYNYKSDKYERDFWGYKFEITYQDISQLESEKSIGSSFSLHQNYPNPFNPTTTIEYTIPVGTTHELSEQNVKIVLFDALGRLVETLIDQKQPYGKYLIVFDASNLTSGIYYYSLLIDNNIETRKMILLK